MFPSNPHAAAIAALSALGSDLTVMRGRAYKLFTDNANDASNANGSAAFKRRSRSRASARSRASVSSRSSKRSSRTTYSSCSSSKSVSRASRSKGKQRAKAKSTTSSHASSTKANAMRSGNGNNGKTSSKTRRTVLTVSAQPKPEKYVPPPRGTFRSSYTRVLRSEVIGAIISDIENFGMPEPDSVLLIADNSELLKVLTMQYQGQRRGDGPSSLSSSNASGSTPVSGSGAIRPEQQQQLTKRPTPATPVPVVPINKLRIEDLPTLGLAEFDFFSASRSRSSDIKETSPIWSRSPAAPVPPRVRQWIKEARKQSVGRIEEDAECPRPETPLGEGKDK